MAARHRSRRSPRRRREESHLGRNILLGLAALAAAGVLGGAFFLMNRLEKTSAIDEATLCPKATGPLAEVAVLFDLTDPLSPAQSSQLRQYLEQEFATAATGTQFTLGVVSEDPADWGATDPLCKPASGAEADQLTQNKAFLQERYDQRFRAPIEASLERMISASAAKTSPIMESLQALAADTPGFLTFSGPRRLILVSDLLQNSDAMSFYRGEDWQSFEASPDFQRLGRTLGGVEIDIFAVPRALDKIRDPAAVEDFWIRYFELQGAHLPRLRSLGDL
jgi:hypothetical protein